MIYLNGERKSEQKLFCYLYCAENDYEVVNVTEDLSEVYECDVMVVANAPKLSRDAIEYYGIVDNLKSIGVKVEFAITEENAGRYIDLITKEFKKNKVG